MKIGCCVPFAQYTLVKRSGYDFIELPGNALMALSLADQDALVQTVKNGSLPCCGFNAALPASVKICGPDFDKDKLRAYAQGLCALGHRLSIRNIGIGSPSSRAMPPNFDRARAWEQTRVCLEIFSAAAQAYGQTVSWEPLNELETDFGIDYAESAQMIEELSLPNVGLVCDLYHLGYRREDPHVVERYAHLVRHLHIAQYEKGKRMYPSTPYIDQYLSYLRPVCKAGFDGVISTEAFDGDPSVEIPRALPFLKNLLAQI